MTAQAFLQLQNNVPTSVIATVVSAGVGNAGQLVALAPSGLLDPSVLPNNTVITRTTSEALAAGAYFNEWNSSGLIRIRNADNTGGAAKRAHGFTLAAIGNGASGNVNIGNGVNSSLSGLTIGTQYFLGTVGAAISPGPSASGTVSQSLGVASSATELDTIIGEVFIN